MPAYLSRSEFEDRSDMPSEYLDAIEDRSPGWIDAQLLQWSAWIDARLAKRYRVPFDRQPYPAIVQLWLAVLVTMRCWIRRGVDASDIDMEIIRQDYERCLRDIEEAANAESGLYELPLIQGEAGSGIVRGAPLGYSERSPYAWHREQAREGRRDDGRGGGT